MFFFLSLLTLDQLTKLWAHHRGWVVLNGGLAFGLGSGWVVVMMTVLALVMIACYLRYQHLPRWFWSLFLAGTISNLIDRLFLAGRVRDWLPIPGLNLTNNLADWFLFIGIVIYILKYGYEHRNII